MSKVSYSYEGSGIQVLLTGPTLSVVLYLVWTEGNGEAVGDHEHQSWASLGVKSRQQDFEG